MSVFIAPAVEAGTSIITGLLNQKGNARAQKLASDIANAQRSNNLADQSYLMVVQRNQQSPPTRYEYDNMVAPYMAAIQSGDINTLRSVGLWTDAYIANIAAQHPVYGPQMLPPAPTVVPPSGSTSQAPQMGPPYHPDSGLPSWALPAGIAAAALLLMTTMMGRRGKS
jgi:hypothetical protein